MRVAPNRVVAPSPVERSPFHRIAIGKQHRHLVAIGFHAHRVGREHIGAIEEIGDAAETLGFALRAVDVPGKIEAGERFVGVRIAVGGNFECEGTLGKPCDGEFLVGRLVVPFVEFPPVEPHRFQFQQFPVQFECAGFGDRGVRAHAQSRADTGARRMERHIQVDRVDEIAGGSVVLEQNRARGIGFHVCSGRRENAQQDPSFIEEWAPGASLAGALP